MQRSSRIKITMLIITMLTILHSLNGVGNSSDGTTDPEPILFDNEDGNWTAVWDLNNPMNYSLSRIELVDGKASLKLKNINIKENPEKGFKNGTLDLTRLYGTFGLGLDLSKNYYTLISDTNNNRVVQVDYSKWFWQYGSNTSSGYGQNLLNKPSFALRLDDNATLITDTLSNRVLVIGPNGEFKWQYGSNTTSGIGDNRLNLPTSAVPTNQNHILIADTGNNYIVEVNLNKNWIWQYGFSSNDPGDWDPSESDLENPTYGEQTSNGTILIADRGNHRVLEVTRAKQNIWQYGKKGTPGFEFNRLNAPQFASKLENGNIIIADTNNHRIIEIDRTGNIRWQYGKAGSSGSGKNRLSYPTCATRFPNGNTLITDAGNHRVLEVNKTGVIIWQYGTNGTSGTGENYLNTPHSAIPIKKEALLGVYISQVLDGGDITNWTTINWNPLLSEDTYILLFTKTGNSQIVTQSGWSDWSDIYDDYRGENITSPANRYIQYAAMFISYNPNMSPFLKEVEVKGARYEQNGELQTEYFEPPDLISWQSLSWDVQRYGQIVQPYYKTSNGMLWQKVKSSGDLNGVSTETGKIKFKFSFSTSNPIISPILDDFSLVFERLGEISRIEIIPNRTEIIVGDQIDFIAEGYDLYGRKLIIEPNWESNVGIIENGTFTAQTKIGTGYINATYDNVTGSSMIILLPGQLERITVEPNDVTVIAGEEHYFDAFGYDGYNNEVLIEPEWSSNIGKMVDNLLIAQDFAEVGTVKAEVENVIGYSNVTVKLNSSRHHPPKILEKLPDQIKPEDSLPWMLNLATYEWDDEDIGENLVWYLTDVNKSLYSVTGEYSEIDILTFIPKPDSYGNDLATIWLIDSDNMTDNQPIWINITPVNDKPVIENVPDISVHYEEEYTFDYSNYIYDIETPDNDLKLTVIEPPNQKYTKVKGLNVTYNYPKNMFNEEVMITISVSDGEASAEDVFQISISDNHAPILKKPLPQILMYEGETKDFVFNLDDYFYDPDNDLLTYFYTSQFLSVNVHNNHSVTITSPKLWYGSENIIFRAMDPHGGMAEGFVTVNVIEVNNPPQILPIPEIYVHHDYDYRFNLSKYVFDPDNETKELKIWTSDPEHITFPDNEEDIMILNYPESYLGMSFETTINVTDGLEMTWAKFRIYVTDNFPPILAKNLIDIYFEEDTGIKNALNLSEYFSDFDDKILSYSYYSEDNDNITILINQNGTVDFSSKKDWFGSTNVFFKAKDHTNAFVESGLKVAVIPINDPPIITEIPTQTGKVGKPWILDISNYLADIDNNITELEIYVDSDIVTITGTQLTFYPLKEIDTELEIVISDGTSNTTGTFKVKITDIEKEKNKELMQMVCLLILVIILFIIGAILVVYRVKRGDFIVTDVFLIHKNGVLIKYQGSTLKENKDEDIIGSMLTAVQSFITDSFADGTKEEKDDWGLNQLKLGKHEILLERGKNIYIAVIYKGRPGKRLPQKLTECIKEIEKTYGNALENWNGSYSDLKGIENMIKSLITELPGEKKGEKKGKKKTFQLSKTQPSKKINFLPTTPTQQPLLPPYQNIQNSQQNFQQPSNFPSNRISSNNNLQSQSKSISNSPTYQTSNQLPVKTPKDYPIKMPKQPHQQYYSQPPPHISNQPLQSIKEPSKPFNFRIRNDL